MSYTGHTFEYLIVRFYKMRCFDFLPDAVFPRSGNVQDTNGHDRRSDTLAISGRSSLIRLNYAGLPQAEVRSDVEEI